MTASDPTFLLVHGACHGPGSWRRLRSELDDFGLSSLVVDLPSSNVDRSALGNFDDDVAAVRAAVASVHDAVIVAHSYGGAPVTRAAVGASNVSQIVYLTAFMLTEEQSLGDAGGEDDGSWTVSSDGLTIAATDPASLFYNCCDPETVVEAMAQLRFQRAEVFSRPVGGAAWRDVHSTYVVCERDRAIPVSLQEEMSLNADEVRRLDTDHSPFLSRPRETAVLLRDVARKAH